jgi:uncharacterized membrane protein (UPF0127 family)
MRSFIVLLLFGVKAVWAQQAAMPVLELSAGMHRIEAEIANTTDSRMTGLMHRKFMPIQRGMLFVFPTPGTHCMWMRNTDLPLSVAFLDDKGRILNIEDMKPHTEDNHCAAQPARYALEMNLGWFKARGIKAGMSLAGIDKVPPPR